MNQLQTPSLPKTADSPLVRQLLAGMDELVRGLLRKHVFLTRYRTGRLIQQISGDTRALILKWGEQNRIKTNGLALKVFLPPILPEYVGVPLKMLKVDGPGVTIITVFPSGYALDLKTKPTINLAANFSATDVRIYEFQTDGTNWFVDAA